MYRTESELILLRVLTDFHAKDLQQARGFPYEDLLATPAVLIPLAPSASQAKTRYLWRVPEAAQRQRESALPINWGVAFPLAHAVLPWSISLHSVRDGWSGGLPGVWNLIGILPIGAGLATIVWALSLHFVSAEQGWELEMTPSYLLVRGPYRFTRNPTYEAAIAIWFGWTVFYGSAAVLVGLAAIWTAVEFAVVPFEERRLEQRWGGAYREYRRQVPRWIGSRTV